MAGIDENDVVIPIADYVELIETLGTTVINTCRAIAKEQGGVAVYLEEGESHPEYVYPVPDLADRWHKVCICIQQRNPVKRMLAQILVDIRPFPCYETFIQYIFKIMDMPIIRNLP